MLTDAEVARYRVDGLVVPALRLPTAVVAEMAASMDALLSGRPDLSPNYIAGLAELDPGWLTFARRPEILAAVQRILGADFLLWSTVLFGRPAAGGLATP